MTDLFSKYSNNLSFNDENKKCWKKGDFSNATNNSTISLHISVYENSNEASSDFLNKSFRKSLLIQKQKQINPFSTFVSQNSFEFQRQQNDKVPEPEVTQFKASQQLFNEGPKPANPPPVGRPLCLSAGEKLHKRFIVENLIGQGSFGQIFAGKDTLKNNRKVAIKVEPRFINNTGAAADQDPRRLIIERNVLIELRGKRHIPLIFASGKSSASNENPYFVMEFLGDNLTNLRKARKQQKFSQSTSFRIAQQISLALENLHSIGYIHRDIKPSNCCIGMENKKRIYLVDFGMCRKWRLDDGKTRSPREKAPFRGTIRYASHRALIQQECGPADDLIGWLYSVIELYVGHLPWAKTPDPLEIIRQKSTISNQELCESMPPPFLECFEYANSLGLNVIPDYVKVQKCLHDCLPDNCNINEPFDWE